MGVSGMGMMLKSMLGVDPQEIAAFMSEGKQMLVDTLAHFDAKLTAQTLVIEELRCEVAALRKVAEAERGIFDD
jgi:hypothetical protein